LVEKLDEKVPCVVLGDAVALWHPVVSIFHIKLIPSRIFMNFYLSLVLSLQVPHPWRKSWHLLLSDIICEALDTQ
jgi:hypothetical protein